MLVRAGGAVRVSGAKLRVVGIQNVISVVLRVHPRCYDGRNIDLSCRNVLRDGRP